MNERVSYARSLAAIVVDEINKAPRRPRGALVLRVRSSAGVFASATALFDSDAARVFHGEVVPPGMPSATLTADEGALREMMAGKGARGRVLVEGDAILMAALREALLGKNALSVRMKPLAKRAPTARE